MTATDRIENIIPRFRITFGDSGKENLTVENAAIDQVRSVKIKEMVVEQKLDAPDSFRLRYSGMHYAKRMEYPDLKPGEAVSIDIGHKQPEPLFRGEISYLEVIYDPSAHQAIFEVAGFDRSHRLTRGTRSRTWGDGLSANVKYGDVFSNVVQEAKADQGSGQDELTVGTAAPGGPQVSYVPQLNTTDYQFIRSLGADMDVATDGESVTSGKTVEFRKVEPKGQVALEICFDKISGKDSTRARRAQFRVSTVRQLAKVVVRGWDPKTKKTIIGEATSASTSFGVDKGHEIAGQAHWGGASAGKQLVVVDHPVESKGEAEAVAQAIFDQAAMDFLQADILIKGHTSISPGVVVKCTGFGDVFDGKYLVMDATHMFIAGGRGYETRVTVARNGANNLK